MKNGDKVMVFDNLSLHGCVGFIEKMGAGKIYVDMAIKGKQQTVTFRSKDLIKL